MADSKPYLSSIIRQEDIELPSNEKIFKRSIDTLTPEDNKIPDESATEEPLENIDNEEEATVYSDQEPEFIFEVAANDDLDDDQDLASSGIVFRPLFSYRIKQIQRRRRFGRSIQRPSTIEYESFAEDSAPQETRNKRSASPTTTKEEKTILPQRSGVRGENLFDAESSIVFRPLFRYRHRYVQRRRARQ